MSILAALVGTPLRGFPWGAMRGRKILRPRKGAHTLSSKGARLVRSAYARAASPLRNATSIGMPLNGMENQESAGILFVTTS